MNALNPLKQVREWYSQRRLKAAIMALNTLIQQKDPRIMDPINKAAARRAQEMAHQIAMAWLDQKRIHHCKDCSTTDQLLSVGGFYYCKAHAEKIGKADGLVAATPDAMPKQKMSDLRVVR